MSDEYPSNSNSKRDGKPQVPTREKRPAPKERPVDEIIDVERTVRTANVTPRVRKESFIKRSIRSLFGSEPDGVVSYVLWDVLIPAAKETVQDMVTQGIEMFLFPDSSRRRRSRSSSRSGSRGVVSYGNMYRNDSNPPPWQRDRSSRKASSIPNRTRSVGPKSRLQDVVFETGGEAQEVLAIMSEILEQYGEVTVADFYDVAGLQNHAEATDNSWGWTDLQNTGISRTRDGYVISFPRTKQF